MRPGFEIPEELLEDYYGGDAGEAEEEEEDEEDEEVLEDYYGGGGDEAVDEESQIEEKNEGDSAEKEILVKENEESEFFDGSDSVTSLGQPTGRDDDSTNEVTLSNQHFKFSTEVKCR